jgi:hypothetical protein
MRHLPNGLLSTYKRRPLSSSFKNTSRKRARSKSKTPWLRPQLYRVV